jgi:hypothetical protein
MMDIQDKIAFLQDIAVICPVDGESMGIDFVDDEEMQVHCEGKVTGESYCIELSEVDFKNWVFYKLEQVKYPE